MQKSNDPPNARRLVWIRASTLTFDCLMTATHTTWPLEIRRVSKDTLSDDPDPCADLASSSVLRVSTPMDDSQVFGTDGEAGMMDQTLQMLNADPGMETRLDVVQWDVIRDSDHGSAMLSDSGLLILQADLAGLGVSKSGG